MCPPGDGNNNLHLGNAHARPTNDIFACVTANYKLWTIDQYLMPPCPVSVRSEDIEGDVESLSNTLSANYKLVLRRLGVRGGMLRIFCTPWPLLAITS